MTEHEWLTCTDPTPMLEFVRDTASDRKLRLFAVASCRTVWLRFPNDACRRVVHLAEAYADDLASQPDLLSACYEASQTKLLLLAELDFEGGCFLAMALGTAYTPPRASTTYESIKSLRDIFGNLFSSVTFDPAWRTSTVVALAEGIYAERAFDRMPILADALQDAGCDSDDVLTHCRGDGPHCRGCWVVDLVLGKE